MSCEDGVNPFPGDLTLSTITSQFFLNHEIPPQLAIPWADHLNRLHGTQGPEAAWHGFTSELWSIQWGVPVARAVYQRLFSDRPVDLGPPPCWRASARESAATNTFLAIQSLGLKHYKDLFDWSVDQRESYWSFVIECLNIQFRRPPTELVDMSEGATYPRWLPGAEMNIVESCFNASPDLAALVFDRGDGGVVRWSYGDLKALCGQVANGLVELGFSPGDAAAIDMPMSPESVAIYLGILAVGGVVVSIADSFSTPEIATRLRIGKAHLVFTQDVIQRGTKQLPMYTKVKDANPRQVIVLPSAGTAALQLRGEDLWWDDFLHPESHHSVHTGGALETINILFSSGTTGDPKAIPWNHTTAIKSAADGYFHQDIQTQDVVAWPTNLGWMMGPWLIFATLINRGTIALYGGTPTSRSFLEFCAQVKVNMLGLVPSLVKAWLAQDALAGIDFTALKCFSSTGECSNESDMFALMAHAGFRPVIEYCGGTEIGGGYLTSTLLRPSSPATFNTPALGIDFEVLNEDGRAAPKGEVFLVPPSMGLSLSLLNRDHQQTYYADTPRSKNGEPLRRHGDQIEIMAGGYYRALGRSDDTMNLGGIKTSSAEIERVIKQIDGVSEVAAIAVAPDGGPSLLVIFAVFAGNAPADIKKAIQAAIKDQLNPLFKVHQVVDVAQLPRTASGKVMRRVLRDQYEHQAT